MAGQIARVLRPAVLGEIGRRAHQQDAHLAQPPRAQAGVGQGGNTHRQVEALGHQIHVCVTELDVQFHVRVLAQEARQQWRQPGHAERHRRGHPYQPAQRGRAVGDLGLHRLALVKDARGAFQRGLAGAGQRHAPRGAVEQGGADARFQPGDGLGHGGLRQFQRLRGTGEGAGFGHLGEDGPGFQIGELAHDGGRRPAAAWPTAWHEWKECIFISSIQNMMMPT